MPWLSSTSVSTAPSSTAWKKLGQPEPESNFASEREKLGAARAAAEDAVLLDEVEVAGPGRLGRGAAEDRVALGIELLLPLLVCLSDLFHVDQSTEA